MNRNSSIRSIVFIALFAALFIVMSAIQIKIGLPVPITLQTLAVTLAGAFLGPRNGFLAMLAVIVLTATGLPLLNGQGGFAVLTGATGGFIFAFPFCAMLIGFAARAALRSSYLQNNRIASIIVLFVIFELFGSFLAYVPGIPWLMHVTDWSFEKAMVGGCYPFLAGDAIKSAIAVVLTLSLKPYILRIQSSMTGEQKRSAPPTTV